MKKFRCAAIALALCLPGSGAASSPGRFGPAGSPARESTAAAQTPSAQVTQELASPDRAVRLRAVRLLKDAASPEAALPLVAAITDVDDEVQVEAIAAALNIFLAQKIVTRKRVALVIEVRNQVAAESAFSQGPLAIGPRPVPSELLMALRAAAQDTNPRVAVEALYAFGVLAVEPGGARRRELLRTTGPALIAMVGAADPSHRYAAVRVIGRLFERRTPDEPVDTTLGDAIVGVLNDGDRNIRGAAMQALGAMGYERAVQALSDQFLYFGRGDLAEAALDAVARIAHPASATLLAAQLASKSAGLKAIAIEGLVRMGDRSRLPGIEAAMAGESGDAVLLAGTFASIVLGDRPIDALAEGLRRPRQAAQTRRYLIELAPGRTAAFGRFAQDPDAAIRAGVADVLGLAGDLAALPLVESLLRDRDPQVVLSAERAVARLQAIRRAE
ncbi:MAG: HEAT repeat domain-containing protein [Acidobacteriota bacterium]